MNPSLPSITFEEAEQQMQSVDLDAILAEEQTLLLARLAQLAKVYNAVRPVLALAATLPLPAPWRKGLALLVAAIEAVVPGGVTASFKAGRDLEE
jgi:hypothetical protein